MRYSASILAALLVACGTYDVHTRSDLVDLDRSHFPTLAISGPLLFFPHRPHQAFQYAYDLADVLSSEGQVPVVAPWEYASGEAQRDPRAQADGLYVISTLSPVSMADIALLELSVDESSLSRSVSEPLSMGGGVHHRQNVEVEVTLAMRSFPDGADLASVHVEFTDDPFAEGADPANPRPLLREAVRVAGRELLALLRERWPEGAPGAPAPVDVMFNPRDMFTYDTGAGEVLEDDFAQMDALDRLANRYAYYQYFAPDIDSATMVFFEHAPAGLMVVAVGERFTGGEGLEAGDYIVAVDSVPVGGAQTLQRSFLLGQSGDIVEITVLRDDDLVDLRLPLP